MEKLNPKRPYFTFEYKFPSDKPPEKKKNPAHTAKHRGALGGRTCKWACANIFSVFRPCSVDKFAGQDKMATGRASGAHLALTCRSVKRFKSDVKSEDEGGLR